MPRRLRKFPCVVNGQRWFDLLNGQTMTANSVSYKHSPEDSERCTTGVEGLDDILAGGLPRDCFYLVQGDPGSGKTTLALQFLLEGLRRGEKVFYITLSETKRELLNVARSHGWTLDDIPLLELSAIETLLRPEAQTTVFHPSEVELTKVSQLLLDEARKAQPTRVAFDSLSEFRLIVAYTVGFCLITQSSAVPIVCSHSKPI